MKIGLITVYYANFGSYFQAVALKDYLEGMGHECLTLNASIRGMKVAKFLCAAAFGKIAPEALNKRLEEVNAPYRIYRSLAKSIDGLNVTPAFKGLSIQKELDCICVGSDELWSASLEEMGYIPKYFGIGVNKPHFSYATSGASIDFDADLPWEEMKKGFNGFSSISVRDNKTQEMVKKVCGKNVTRCIDPTLLNPFFIDLEKASADGYLLIYGVHYSDDDKRKIRSYAKENKLKIRGISWKHDFLDEFIEPRSPKEFVEQFLHASFVVPSTFHGTIFSILSHTPFASFPAKQKATKIIDLLELIGLEERNAAAVSDLSDLGPIDWNGVESRLELLRNESSAYLESALETMRGEVA